MNPEDSNRNLQGVGNYVRVTLLCAGLLCCSFTKAQPTIQGSAANPVQPVPSVDLLGRSTPRGTVLGFLRAAHGGDDQAAAQYLNTNLRGKAAADLAHQLFVVLDRRLPARLNELSERPEGSLLFLTRPDQDLVGTVISGTEKTDILLERVSRDKALVWLFSKATLDAVPALFGEENTVSIEHVLPAFLVKTRIAHISLFEWLCIVLGLPCLYLFTALLSNRLSRWIGYFRRLLRKNPSLSDPAFLAGPVRLLTMVLVIWWGLSEITLPLFARQFWVGTATTLTMASGVWVFILVNRRLEDLVRRRVERFNKTGPKSILRFARRTLDVLAIFVGLLAVLRYFGVNTAAAVAGLGVGGIAVALAAQKTLENVIGGISIILDHAVRIGDVLNVGTTMGEVESVGLRSTRIRTLDRTVMSVPNGQLANAQLENFSARDKFWLNHNLCLRHETTADRMRSITGEIHYLLAQCALVDKESIRVRFFRLSTSSLDIEIFAYVSASDWPHFLEIQEDLLLQIMKVVETAGARIATPSQIMCVVTNPMSTSELLPPPLKSGAGPEVLTGSRRDRA